MSEQYVNLANSTTVGSIDGVTNPITFSVQSGDGALFPTTVNGVFRVTVCDTNGANAEVMMVTSRATDTFTASRGAGALLETPTPTLIAHAGGSIVSHDLTAGAMTTIITQVSPIYTPPIGLTLHDGAGGAVLTTDSYGLTLDTPSDAGNSVIYCSTALATSTYTAIFGFRGGMYNANFAQVGPCITDGTKLITWRFTQTPFANDIYYWSVYNNPVTQFDTHGISHWGMSGVFCKIVQDSTHRTFYIMDSRLRTSVQIFQQTALTSLTENAVGFFALSNNGLHAFVEGFHLKVQ